MIQTKQELRFYLNVESKIYCPNTLKEIIFYRLTNYRDYVLWRYIKLLRYTEYYRNNKNKSIFHEIMYLLTLRKKNTYGYKLGFEICENVFDEGLTISHTGNIVINGEARVGKRCILHGDNCIGNNGISGDAPVIGDDVDIGVGAKIIGGVKLGNRIKIGAGAVVVNSFEEDDITLVGIPARKVKNTNSN